MDTFEKLQTIIAEELCVDKSEVTMDADFRKDLEADSLYLYQVIVRIEEEFDIEIPDDVAESIVTVADAVEKVSELIG